MVHFYLLDTEKEADKASSWIQDKLLGLINNYDAIKWFTPLQIPETAPLKFRGKWIVKLPVGELKTGLEGERWRLLKTEITSMDKYDVARVYSITLEDFNKYMNREDEII